MGNIRCPFTHLLILDFETTSEEANCDYPFEVIQFSVVVLDVKTNTILENVSFNKYVRPVINPILSKHCADFTGIAQESLDSAATFREVYNQFVNWLNTNGFAERQFAVVCDSRQDMWRIAQYQFKLINATLPSFFRQYVSLWRAFEAEQDRSGRKELLEKTYIGKMAEYYGLDTTGRAHDSLNDCKTIATIVQKMLATGATIHINEVLVCSAVWRKRPAEIAPNWREDFREAGRIYERVMPLVVKPLRNGEYTTRDYGLCKYCKTGPEVCGKKHRQYPKELYEQERRTIVYARTAGYY
ncbi:CBN-CRN-4 protein [Caenorhabditis brenneri]|uniref:CBN-CRN-4 protein n=1 Tax=Caenorhabditis brenneri TaxID=135651 RepID=G0M796_CAEBE|nr:CBN-CRN-4 protein [Caenorhabditis brenneri]